MAREFLVSVELPDGTEASPALRFASDPNTGIRSSGADSMSFSVGGADALTVDADGVSVVENVRHSAGTSRSTAMLDLEILAWMD